MAFGLFMMFANALKIPSLKTSKAVMTAGRDDKKISKTIDAVLVETAGRLGKIFRMDKYKRNRLEKTLRSAGIKMTPEAFTVYAMLKAFGICLLAVPCSFFFPLIIPLIVILAVAVYFKEIGKADEAMREKRGAIEKELPRFVATVEQELKTSRDILSIMENYKKHAGVHFCADMRSSSYEAALTRFEARIGSSQLSDVVRGLISVIRGDDSAVYFKMLAHDFKLIELQRLKAEAQKIPPKIRVFSFGMLMLFLLTYFAVMGMQLLDSLGSMI